MRTARTKEEKEVIWSVRMCYVPIGCYLFIFCFHSVILSLYIHSFSAWRAVIMEEAHPTDAMQLALVKGLKGADREKREGVLLVDSVVVVVVMVLQGRS